MITISAGFLPEGPAGTIIIFCLCRPSVLMNIQLADQVVRVP